MKKSQLTEMIRAIVAEEVRKQLPNVVSEMYLKKLVSEASIPETSWEDSFDAELQRRSEFIPEPMMNSDEGAYQRGGRIKRKNESQKQKNESIAGKLLSRENEMSYLYEGLSPIRNQESGQMDTPNVAAPVTDVPLDALGLKPGMFKGTDFNKPSSNAPMRQSAEAEQRRIENLRASLDIKV